MIILGIDPGLADVGYGLIKAEGQTLTALDYGVIKTKRGGELAERLKYICAEVRILIKKYQPQYLGIEDIYFCNNAKTAFLVGQAKGALLLTAGDAGLKVKELTPLQIKQTVAGYGGADKLQIQKMVQILLKLKVLPSPDHAADALAAAITCSRYEKKFS